MKCPNFKNREVVKDFNTIVEKLGGLPMSMEEFMDPEIRNQRSGVDYLSMEKAYRLWDQYDGNMDAILSNLDTQSVRYIDPHTQRANESDSLNILSILSNKIMDQFLGVDIQFISVDDVPIEYHGQPAYRIGTTVYLVEENVTMDSPMHELGHIWIDVMEQSDPSLFSEIMSSINSLVENGNPLALAVKNNCNNLSDAAIAKEIFCKLLGLNSIEKVRAYAKKNNIDVSDDLLKRTYDFIKNFMDKVMKAISTFFNGVDVNSNDTLDSVTNKLIDAVLYDKSVWLGMDVQEELEIIQNRNETDFNENVVSNVSDIKHLIMGSEKSIYEVATDEELAKNYAKTNLIQDTSTGKFRFNYGPINLLLPGNTLEEATQSLIKDALPLLKEFDVNFAGRFAKYVIDVSKNKVDPETAGQKLFPQSNINVGYFTKLYESLNLYDEVDGVYTFEELQKSSDPILRGISTNLVSGNYMIIVHKKEGKDVEVSLVEIVPSKTNNVIDKYRNKKNVFKNFIKSDSKASNMGVTLKHSLIASRQISNGFIAKAMSINAKTTGANLKFRSIGTLGRAGSKHSYMQVVDIQELQNNMDVLKNVEEFKSMIDSDVLKIVESSESIAPLQSPIEKTIRYYEAQTYELVGQNIENKADINTLRNGTPVDKKYVITKLMSRISEEDRGGQEYRLLAQSLVEYHMTKYTTSNRLDDMSKMATMFMNPHNFQSDMLQLFQTEYNIAKGIVVDNSVKWQRTANEYVKKIINSKINNVVRSRFQDYGSKMFEHLYKKVKGTDENGNEVEIILPGEIHWAKNAGTESIPNWQFNDAETRRLYESGELTDTDLLYAEKVLNQVHDIYTKIQYENHKYDKIKHDDGTYGLYTMADAEKYVNATVSRGFVPVMDKTANEMMFSYSILEGTKRIIENISNPNVVFEDMVEQGKNMDELRTVFSSQIEQAVRMSNYGIGIKNGEYFIQNKDLYKRMSTNVDRIMAVFTLAQNRAIVYSDRLIPLRNSISSTFDLYEDLQKDQTWNKQALKYLSDRLIDQKHEISKEGKGKLAKWVDTSSTLLTFAHIFGKVSLFVKSLVWNNVRDIIVSTSNALAQNGNYNPVDYTRAQTAVAGNVNLAYTLARDMQVIDRSEWDVVSNPLLIKSDRNIFQTWFGFLPNYLSDSHSRIVTMVAQMMHDGTWDAYSLNEETGEVDYDERKDTRMSDENGELTEEGKVLKAAIKADLVEQGLMDAKAEKLTRGYDYQDATRFKYLSDKYNVGSYDNASKSLGAQTTLMRMVLKFRLFSTDRLQNAGLFMDERKSMAEGKRVVIKDAEGNLISKRDMADMEGAWQSWKKVARLLISLRSKESAKRAIAEMNPTTRANLARTLLQMVTWYAIQGVVLGFGGDDDDETPEEKREKEYMRRQWSWLYSDIMTTPLIYDFYKNPMPVIDNVFSFVEATEKLVVKGKVSKELTNFVPGAGIWKDVDTFNDALMGNDKYQRRAEKRAEVEREEKLNNQ